MTYFCCEDFTIGYRRPDTLGHRAWQPVDAHRVRYHAARLSDDAWRGGEVPDKVKCAVPLRSETANWFELYVPHHQTVYALQLMAGWGDVELESGATSDAPLEVGRLEPYLYEFARLRQRCGTHWPDRPLCPSPLPQTPEDTAAQALAVVREWCEEIEGVNKRIEALEQERAQLVLLSELLATNRQRQALVSALAGDPEMLYKRLLACEPGVRVDLPDDVISTVLEGRKHRFLIVVGTFEHKEAIDSALKQVDCRTLEVPEWLTHTPESVAQQVTERIGDVRTEIDDLYGQIEARRNDRRLVESLAELELLRWYLGQAPEVAVDERLCHVTGWTSESDPAVLAKALRRSGIEAVVRFAEPPQGVEAPARAPRSWVGRLFRAYVEMYGAPGRDEVEPSGLLLVVVPLLFGYMFPDVGHGLVLLAVSAILYRRWPAGRFLLPCSISAVAFGFVFGEVFGSEAVLPALWIHPLEDPLQVLLVPLLIGIGLIVLGFGLAGMQAYWSGGFGAWFATQGAVPVLYVSIIAGVLYRPAFYLAIFALLWYGLGTLWLHRRRALAGLIVAFGWLGKGLFQALLNTVSFVRVGAFALAHAGFSEAVGLVGSSIAQPVLYGIFIVIAHVLLIALEALIVAAQTTRLVFFEFFVRFLRAEGRGFVPMEPSGRR